MILLTIQPCDMLHVDVKTLLPWVVRFKLNWLEAQIADILEPEIACVVDVAWNMMREVWLMTILSFDGKSVSKKILHRIFQGDWQRDVG